MEIELGAAEGPVATTGKEAKFWITETANRELMSAWAEGAPPVAGVGEPGGLWR